MDSLTGLLLNLSSMQKLPLDNIKQISGLVLNKTVMQSVILNDIDTLKSIYHFQKDQFRRYEIQIYFHAERFNNSALKKFLNDIKN